MQTNARLKVECCIAVPVLIQLDATWRRLHPLEIHEFRYKLVQKPDRPRVPCTCRCLARKVGSVISRTVNLPAHTHVHVRNHSVNTCSTGVDRHLVSVLALEHSANIYCIHDGTTLAALMGLRPSKRSRDGTDMTGSEALQQRTRCNNARRTCKIHMKAKDGDIKFACSSDSFTFRGSFLILILLWVFSTFLLLSRSWGVRSVTWCLALSLCNNPSQSPSAILLSHQVNNQTQRRSAKSCVPLIDVHMPKTNHTLSKYISQLCM